MASADVMLTIDRDDRVRFAHSPWRALVFALISGGFVWLCWNYVRDDNLLRFVFTGFSSLFLLVGVIGVFWRQELDIDLYRRLLRTRRGLWPNPRTRDRSLDEVDGIWLTLDYRSSGSKGNKRKVPWWFVSLEIPGEKKGTRIFATRNEVEGYKKWEYYAKRLGIDAIDATSGQPVRKDSSELDVNLGAQANVLGDHSVETPVQPAGSSIDVFWNANGKEFLLPRIGFNGGLVFLALFGGLFVALGGSVLLVNVGVLDFEVEGSRAALTIVPPVFVFAGLFVIWLGIKSSYSSLAIGIDGNALYTESLAFGRRSGRKSVPLDDIEAIGVGGDIRSRRREGGYVRIGPVGFDKRKYRERGKEVIVRSDGTILRFGRSLPAEDKAWLADACRYATIRGQLP